MNSNSRCHRDGSLWNQTSSSKCNTAQAHHSWMLHLLPSNQDLVARVQLSTGWSRAQGIVSRNFTLSWTPLGRWGSRDWGAQYERDCYQHDPYDTDHYTAARVLRTPALVTGLFGLSNALIAILDALHIIRAQVLGLSVRGMHGCFERACELIYDLEWNMDSMGACWKLTVCKTLQENQSMPIESPRKKTLCQRQCADSCRGLNW